MKKMIISWGHNITRSSSLAIELEAIDIHIQPTFKKKYLKIFNYLISSLKMILILFRYKPDLLVVTLPPIFLLYVSFFYRIFFKVKIVADLHNGVLRPEWSSWPLMQNLLRSCHSVLIHNVQVKKIVDDRFKLKGNSHVLSDPIKKFIFSESGSKFLMPEKINVLVPVSYSSDEPIENIIEVAKMLSDNFNFIFTGNYSKYFNKSFIDGLPVTFTGFISYKEYENILFGCDCVLCLTTDENIQMCAVVESVSAKKNFICTNNSVNNDLFAGMFLDTTDCDVNSIYSVFKKHEENFNADFNLIDDQKLHHYIKRWEASFEKSFSFK